jgi:CheY-like chemotaxis protein
MRRRILFVDDEPRILEGLVRMLRPQRDRIEVMTAPGGEEALALLAREQVDAVVSDMRMPRMDGAALLAEVRQRHPVPVRIILSGQSDQDTILRAVATTHQFLSKPCDPQVLVGTVLAACAWRDLTGQDLEHQQLVSRAAVLPAPAATIARLEAELALPEPSLRRVSGLVAADPAMAAKAMQLVSSTFFGQVRRVESPEEAARLLGLELIRALHRAGCLAAGDDQPEGSAGQSIAAVAQALCRHLGGDARACADAAIAGQLHACGGLAARVSAGRGTLGACLLGLWGLPEPVVAAVAQQEHPPAAAGLVAGAVHAALALAGAVPWDEAWLALQGGPAVVATLRSAAGDAAMPGVR